MVISLSQIHCTFPYIYKSENSLSLYISLARIYPDDTLASEQKPFSLLQVTHKSTTTVSSKNIRLVYREFIPMTHFSLLQVTHTSTTTAVSNTASPTCRPTRVKAAATVHTPPFCVPQSRVPICTSSRRRGPLNCSLRLVPAKYTVWSWSWTALTTGSMLVKKLYCAQAPLIARNCWCYRELDLVGTCHRSGSQ